MNNYLKILLKFFLVVVLLIGLLIGFIFLSIYQKRKSIEEKMIKKSKECNKNLYITQKPIINLCNFNDSDLEELRFQIIRNTKFVKDTTVLNIEREKYLTTLTIPFSDFLKTDTILVTTKSKLQYKISNFKYIVRSYHGMFGPVAISDCILDDFFVINAEKQTSNINKFYGVLKKEKRISNKTDNYKTIINTLNFKENQVDSIVSKKIYKNRRGNYGGINYGLEINKENVFYIRGIETDYNTIEIVKINAKTGECSELLENYPLEEE